MILKDFIENYIEHNSVVRLVYKNKGGHRIVLNDWKDVDMDHQVKSGIGKYAIYVNHKVLGVTSISTGDSHPEAINIVIEEIPVEILRENKLNSIL